MKTSCLSMCPQASTSCPTSSAEKTIYYYFSPLRVVAFGVLIDKEKSNVPVKTEFKLSSPGNTSEFPVKTKNSFSVDTYLREIYICAETCKEYRF